MVSRAVTRPGVKAVSFAVVCTFAVHVAEVVGWWEESTLWNTREPAFRDAGVPVSVGLQLR